MNAIVTISIGSKHKKIFEATRKSIEAYAKKIDAEFIVIENCDTSTPHWAKFKLYELLNKYKRIIYVDDDLIIREDCPNLFNIVPEDSFGAFNEAPYTLQRKEALFHTMNFYNIPLNDWNNVYCNTGVMVISQKHKYLFKKPDKEYNSFFEQSYLNLILQYNKIKMFFLNYRYNRMTCMDNIIGKDRHDSYIIHYAGVPDVYTALMLIDKDLHTWYKDAPYYFYKDHILLDVQGGLGDQICAEPTIRYLLNYIYPGEDVIIKTHYPRIFEHLNIPAYTHETCVLKPDTPYYIANTLPGPETINWSIVSNLLCHTIDYISMSVLHRILPNKDKAIRLKVNTSDIENVKKITNNINLKETIIIHPGRHWESKTFPISWWQEVIDGISNKIQVCLIGLDSTYAGTVPIKINNNIIDTRNLLDLGSLFALISMGNILLTNDSAVNYIAGAFNNHIVLLPSCKHEDHILPFRQGKQNYKTTVMYQKLTLNDCIYKPTTVTEISAEFVKGNILDYIPKPQKVIEKIISLFNNKR